MVNLTDNELRDQFTPEYIEKHGDTVREEVLGIQLSQWAKWDGVRILRVAASALTDANFHREPKLSAA